MELSRRESEVLQLIAEDKTDREIARDLGITERTVRAHVSRIILKLGVSSRMGAAVAVTRLRIHAEYRKWWVQHGGIANMRTFAELPGLPGNITPSNWS